MKTKSTHRSTETVTFATEVAFKIVGEFRERFPDIDFGQLRFECENRSDGPIIDFDFNCWTGRDGRPNDLLFWLRGSNGLGGRMEIEGNFSLTNAVQGYVGLFKGTAKAMGRGFIDVKLDDPDTTMIPPLTAITRED